MVLCSGLGTPSDGSNARPCIRVFTDEVDGNDSLLPFLSYDELFGTVLNRFIVQAAVGHPLTVYGKGGQTRGFLNIKDTLKCVALAIDNPAPKGELRIFNQFTETFSVNDLAERVQKAGEKMGLRVAIKSVPNPRVELEDHYYNPVHSGLTELGLQPNYLTDEVLIELLDLVLKYRDNVRIDRIFYGARWQA